MHIKDCNKCGVEDCMNWKKIEAKDCPMWRPLEDFSNPILLHLLSDDKKVDNALKVLKEANITVKETGRHPFFKLQLG